MPTCITSTPSRCPGCRPAVPAPAAAGLQLLRRPRGLGRPGPVLQVAGASWFRSGMQAVVLPAVGPGCRAAGGVGWCWILSTLSPRGAGCALATGGSVRMPDGCRRGSSGRIECLATWQRCGRVIAAGSVFGKMNLGCCRARVRCAAGRAGAAESGSGRIRMNPRFSAASGAVPGGGFAVVREGV